MAKKLRVGIIGAGNICTSAHLPAYQNLTDRVEVVAIADLVVERAKDAAEKFGIPHYFTTVEELMANVDVDYIDVCTYTGQHAPVCIAAAKAGKNILCEKPLAANLEQGLAIEKAVKEAGVKFMLAVVTRYGDEQQKYMELKEQGVFGDVYAAKTLYTRRRGTPGGWFTDKELAGGGPVLDIGVHAIDRTWYLMGRPTPVTCSAETSYRIGNWTTKGIHRWEPFEKGRGVFDTEDSANVFFRFEGGKTMIAEIAWAQNANGQATTQIFGTKAGCTFEPLHIYGENEEGYLDDYEPEVTKTNMFENEIAHFLDCVNNDKTPISPIEDAVTIQKMLDAIYRSAEAHREVAID
ncbi:MAG: Gfo/Idh/MocA family oxidoreductase [Lachnospiraceae bacterium]|nr:Gfo/Idh/MocA family oxidoreductase [Lachnospiraceae bacterium]